MPDEKINIENRDKVRDTLIDSVFGQSSTPQHSLYEDSKLSDKGTLKDKHIKLKNDIVIVLKKYGYHVSDASINSIVSTFMSNISRLNY